jgi:hypothetical protein
MINLEFVHITKTAGTSIEEWGQNNNFAWGFKNKNYFKKFKSDKMQIKSRWHIPPSYFNENPYNNKITFTCVRNPYTRLISEYYCKYSGSDKAHEKDKDEFNTWIQNLMRKINRASGLPQYVYLPIDNIIYFENLQNDFLKLLNKYDIPNDPLLPHSNKSQHLNIGKFKVNDLNSETIEMIKNIYAQDFKIFGYNLEPPV